MITLKNYPAKNGDAFLLRSSDHEFSMLIDGGYSSTYKQYIRPDLLQIAANGHSLDLVVATHIDADHISGLLTFFTENGESSSPKIISADHILHNSLRSIVVTDEKPSMSSSDQPLHRELKSLGFPLSNTQYNISSRQGNHLANLLLEGQYNWNSGDGSLPIGGNGITDIPLPMGNIKIIGPTKNRLDDLLRWWKRELRTKGFTGSLEGLDDLFEIVCSREICTPRAEPLSTSVDLAQLYSADTSVTNASSISFVIMIDDKNILFLADMLAEDTISSLASTELQIFDAIKISHHGSARNTNVELLSKIDSPLFFISSDGTSHGHPDFAVLKAIVERPSPFQRVLHFNYSTPTSKQLREYQLETKLNFRVNDTGNNAWVEIRGIDS